MTRAPLLVGHSLGGYVVIVAAAVHGDRLAGTVIVDSPVRREDPESEEGREGRSFRRLKVYPDVETAVGRFRLVPPQPVTNDYIFDHIARTSLREADGGFTWKFDPTIFDRFTRKVIIDHLAAIRCRVAVFHGEHSDLIDEEATDYMSELLGRASPFVEIPDSYHHLFLDQPLAFVAALRATLADWEHTVPRRNRREE